MSVEITFEPGHGSGLVAKGTGIWEAAKRLGVPLRAECRGRGECDSCAVTISAGAELLSQVTGAEEKMLGPERLQRAERLGCQANLAASGQVTLQLPPASDAEQKKVDWKNTMRGLSFKEKVGALIELEAITFSEALNTVRAGYHGVIARFLNLRPETAKETKETTANGTQATKESHDDQQPEKSKD